MYRSDFASDAPYEQWTLLPRESLRIIYIDALDRLSRIQLSVGRLDDCIATGHRMLDVDPYREDAHRLLMRYYASHGWVYQAIRQYEFCCRMLKGTLEVEPAPEATRLYRAIRAGSAGKRALLLDVLTATPSGLASSATEICPVGGTPTPGSPMVATHAQLLAWSGCDPERDLKFVCAAHQVCKEVATTEYDEGRSVSLPDASAGG